VDIAYQLYVAEQAVSIPTLGVHINKGESVFLGDQRRPRNLCWAKNLDGEEMFGGSVLADAVDRGHLRLRLQDEKWNGSIVAG
jgi:hypothetical protein